MAALTAWAYAKVNLALEVLGRRADGYHEVRTVLQRISLCDRLVLRPASETSLRCNLPELETPDNLVLQAVRLVQEEADTTSGVAIELHKKIPVGAGLGGGSADAAATLVALDRLWELELNEAHLLSMAQELGSDVPFCLLGGTALAWGRGELVQSLRPLPQTWLLLLCPPLHLEGKTAALYARLQPSHFSQGETAEALARAIERGEGLAENLMVNAFASVVYQAFPELGAYRDAMLQAGARSVHLSGTGPTLYTVGASPEEGLLLEGRLRARGLEPQLVHTVQE